MYCFVLCVWRVYALFAGGIGQLSLFIRCAKVTNVSFFSSATTFGLRIAPCEAHAKVQISPFLSLFVVVWASVTARDAKGWTYQLYGPAGVLFLCICSVFSHFRLENVPGQLKK